MIHAPALPSLDELVDGVRAGRRAMLARAITLVESRKAAHRALAEPLLQALLPFTGGAVRVGITGVPGVGKSTAIDSLGTLLTGKGHRVAVLAVDPSSARTGGSILGDKTRMARLAVDERAFVRPSPSAGTLGGVAARTRETLLICEAAGYDVVLVETVGVGQSETAVAEMTDTFLVLMLPGAGDELQGLKKGIIELADIVAVNKADGDGGTRARAAAGDYRAALHVLGAREAHWSTPVLACSGLTGEGLEELWAQVRLHGERSRQAGAFAARRSAQQVGWMWTLLDERMRERIRTHAGLREDVPKITAEVAAGRLAPGLAAARIAVRLGLEPT
ncbi:methylmalonyl Co-A mutase-associated GTPase MeaB [Ancylobacter oerskovii]|uniref:Methylmalonyl Co-A mutase-associated GTPase MeaB n=1 Tax=Ancylobacter oerskovii TaxID=459519 RepID=A0ABW4YXB8_9HYPH|nr:methylmalonyl Co-A mutase-associated GTPase MeaB [Ancylobacter oerskovii]MBS7542054.1 methylmalonyl Co-A mutase-associated GTPase MeaB [Ancylobacter oerskovii]